MDLTQCGLGVIDEGHPLRVEPFAHFRRQPLSCGWNYIQHVDI